MAKPSMNKHTPQTIKWGHLDSEKPQNHQLFLGMTSCRLLFVIISTAVSNFIRLRSSVILAICVIHSVVGSIPSFLENSVK